MYDNILEYFISIISKYISNPTLFCEPEFHKVVYLMIIENKFNGSLIKINEFIDENNDKLYNNLKIFIEKNMDNLDTLIEKIKKIDNEIKNTSNKLISIFKEYENNIFDEKIRNSILVIYNISAKYKIFNNTYIINNISYNLLEILIKNINYSLKDLSSFNEIVSIMKKYDSTININENFIKRLLYELNNEIKLYNIGNNVFEKIINYLTIILNISTIFYDDIVFLNNYSYFLKKRLLEYNFNIKLELKLLKKIESIINLNPVNIEYFVMLNQIINDLIISRFIQLNVESNSKINYYLIRKENWKELSFHNELKYITPYVSPLKSLLFDESKTSKYLFKKQFSHKRFFYDYYNSTVTIDYLIDNKKYIIKMRLIELIILTTIKENIECNTPDKIYKYLNLNYARDIIMHAINNLIHYKLLIIDDNIFSSFKLNLDWKSNYLNISLLNNHEYI